LYQKKGASPVELLIASESFSDFISNQEYLDRLQTSVKDSADEVVKLKQQIQAEQDEQKALLVEQENQRNILAIKQQEQQQLLEQTKGDQRTYEGLVAGLLAQQQQVNAALFAAIRLESGNGNNGGYPYNDYAFSMTPGGCGPGEGPDRWNYCTRQCVSYAAWAVERSGRQAPVGYGNAKNWVNVAPASWQFNTPQAGDVGVATGGGYGHVVYIEQVYGDGTMRISQYNAQLTGSYSEATVSIYMFNKYIRFP
jgi:regulator of replication initiation timing